MMSKIEMTKNHEKKNMKNKSAKPKHEKNEAQIKNNILVVTAFIFFFFDLHFWFSIFSKVEDFAPTGGPKNIWRKEYLNFSREIPETYMKTKKQQKPITKQNDDKKSRSNEGKLRDTQVGHMNGAKHTLPTATQTRTRRPTHPHTHEDTTLKITIDRTGGWPPILETRHEHFLDKSPSTHKQEKHIGCHCFHFSLFSVFFLILEVFWFFSFSVSLKNWVGQGRGPTHLNIRKIFKCSGSWTPIPRSH